MCKKGLYEQDRTEKRILIIDNASEDGSIEQVKELYPEIECVMLDKNYGFCRAVNIGIEKFRYAVCDSFGIMIQL